MLTEIFDAQVQSSKRKFAVICDQLKRNDPALTQIALYDSFFSFKQPEIDEVCYLLSLIPTSHCPIDTLIIQNIKIGKHGCELIAKILKESKSLKKVSLHHNMLSTEELTIIFTALIYCKQLEELNTNNFGYDTANINDRFNIMKALGSHSTIKEINLSLYFSRLELLTLAYELMKNKFVPKIYLLATHNLDNYGEYEVQLVASNITKYLESKGTYNLYSETLDQKVDKEIAAVIEQKTQLFIKIFFLLQKAFFYINEELKTESPKLDQTTLKAKEAKLQSLFDNPTLKEMLETLPFYINNYFLSKIKQDFNLLRERIRNTKEELERLEKSLSEKTKSHQSKIEANIRYLLKAEELATQYSIENAQQVSSQLEAGLIGRHGWRVQYHIDSYLRDLKSRWNPTEPSCHKDEILKLFKESKAWIEKDIVSCKSSLERETAYLLQTISRSRNELDLYQNELFEKLISWELNYKMVVLYSEILKTQAEIDELFKELDKIMEQYYFSYVIAFKCGLKNTGVPGRFDKEDFYPPKEIMESIERMIRFIHVALDENKSRIKQLPLEASTEYSLKISYYLNSIIPDFETTFQENIPFLELFETTPEKSQDNLPLTRNTRGEIESNKHHKFPVGLVLRDSDECLEIDLTPAAIQKKEPKTSTMLGRIGNFSIKTLGALGQRIKTLLIENPKVVIAADALLKGSAALEQAVMKSVLEKSGTKKGFIENSRNLQAAFEEIQQEFFKIYSKKCDQLGISREDQAGAATLGLLVLSASKGTRKAGIRTAQRLEPLPYSLQWENALYENHKRLYLHVPMDLSLNTFEKGIKAEIEVGRRVLIRAGYEVHDVKLPRNRGFDHVAIKYDTSGEIRDILIVESKFSKTGIAQLSKTKGKGTQMGPKWIDKTLTAMIREEGELKEIAELIQDNWGLVRYKGHVLNTDGLNRWKPLTMKINQLHLDLKK